MHRPLGGTEEALGRLVNETLNERRADQRVAADRRHKQLIALLIVIAASLAARVDPRAGRRGARASRRTRLTDT
jgi:hypothetical protein